MSIGTPNSRQRSQWRAARRSYAHLSARIALIRQRLNYAQMLSAFAAENGVTIKVSDPSWWSRATSALETLENLRYRLGLAMDAAESGELAIRPTADNKDLDIVAPQDLASKWEPYRVNAGAVPTSSDLGIAPLIVLGIIVAVVVGGIITVTALTDSYSKKVDKDIEIATRQAEIHFCADPASTTCAAWQKRRQSAPVKETKSAIDYLLGKGAGKKLAGGFAIAGGIALLIWVLKD
jgi:hypothetical protein